VSPTNEKVTLVIWSEHIFTSYSRASSQLLFDISLLLSATMKVPYEDINFPNRVTPELIRLRWSDICSGFQMLVADDYQADYVQYADHVEFEINAAKKSLHQSALATQWLSENASKLQADKEIRVPVKPGPKIMFTPDAIFKTFMRIQRQNPDAKKMRLYELTAQSLDIGRRTVEKRMDEWHKNNPNANIHQMAEKDALANGLTIKK